MPVRKFCILVLWTIFTVAMWGHAARSIDASAQMLTDKEKRNQIEQMYESYKKSFPRVSDVSPKEAMELRKNQRVVFVDVREPREQEVSMLPGALMREEFLKNLPRYKDEIIVGYCTVSYRSGKLAKKLSKRSVTMLNLRGGILAWVHDGGKVYDRYGETRRIHVYGRKWDLAPEAYATVW